MYRGVRQAVIMVGGKGTRLRPLTYSRPKPIIPVADKPCLGYLIDSFVRGGIEEIILACGYRSQQLADTIGDGSDRGVTIRYSFEDEPRGTGGAIKLLEDELDDVFMAANGDVFADIDIKKEIDTHIDNHADITLALTPVDNPWEFGTACMQDDGRIYRFMEKPKKEDVISNMINAGIYTVNKEMISFIPKDQMYDFSKDLVPMKTEEGSRIWGHVINGIWMDVGRRADVINSNLEVARHVRSIGVVSNSEVTEPVFIGKDAVVQSTVLCGASVMHDAFVTDSTIVNSVIMPGTRVSGADVRDSISGENCIINIGAEISNSIIGDDVTVEKGQILRDQGGQ